MYSGALRFHFTHQIIGPFPPAESRARLGTISLTALNYQKDNAYQCRTLFSGN
uniref:Uncharacterized protein n=1 Tax=Siphoviridae sp. ctJ3t72 TaxID=2826240 RepID=A0A8S5QNH3_9CAUD|nr:MAG TPA: hypothetical protein [Siphoviridae sp. ctJ3t72]